MLALRYDGKKKMSGARVMEIKKEKCKKAKQKI